MATETKQNITVRLADLAPIALSINPDEEEQYREAEKLVNYLWNRWMEHFRNVASSNEVMARVAFQFARLYAQARKDNVATNEFLTDFERKLDEIVVKI